MIRRLLCALGLHDYRWLIMEFDGSVQHITGRQCAAAGCMYVDKFDKEEDPAE